MAGEPVEIEDVGLQQWQKDARVDSLLAGVTVDLLINFFSLALVLLLFRHVVLSLISPSLFDHD